MNVLKDLAGFVAVASMGVFMALVVVSDTPIGMFENLLLMFRVFGG